MTDLVRADDSFLGFEPGHVRRRRRNAVGGDNEWTIIVHLATLAMPENAYHVPDISFIAEIGVAIGKGHQFN
jgi:hypothetical protein